MRMFKNVFPLSLRGSLAKTRENSSDSNNNQNNTIARKVPAQAGVGFAPAPGVGI